MKIDVASIMPETAQGLYCDILESRIMSVPFSEYLTRSVANIWQRRLVLVHKSKVTQCGTWARSQLLEGDDQIVAFINHVGNFLATCEPTDLVTYAHARTWAPVVGLTKPPYVPVTDQIRRITALRPNLRFFLLRPPKGVGNSSDASDTSGDDDDDDDHTPKKSDFFSHGMNAR